MNAQTRVGYGACLAVFDGGEAPAVLRSRVKVRRFERTSSTKLELQTLLWALDLIRPFEGRVTVYTDSQNIMTLQARRARYEKSGYRSKKQRRINHHLLYQAFYQLVDQLDCAFVKVRGHLPSSRKDTVDRLFSLVDRASREALRVDGSAGHLSDLQIPHD